VIQRHLVRAVQRKRPGLTNILLHQDNAPCHRARTMEEVYERLNISLHHPPYSPDLAPCDFALFPRLKGYLRGTHFDNEGDLTTAVNAFLASLTLDDFRDIFTKWCERWQKCIEHNRELFEKVVFINPVREFTLHPSYISQKLAYVDAIRCSMTLPPQTHESSFFIILQLDCKTITTIDLISNVNTHAVHL